MIDPKTLTKRYYTITEVSKMFDVTKSLLRYWEGEFKQIQPRKDRSGVRRYTSKDIVQIDRIFDLLKVRGFTIDGAKKELSKPIKKADEDIKERLEAVLTRLKKLRESLN